MIKIRGASENNLKQISIDIPTGKLVAITGVSGSGKSSLAFDTLFIEGQRRYLESLAAGTRTLFRKLPKPKVDLIEGLAPTIALKQSYTPFGPRALVSTLTDLYDLIALLYARTGVQASPATGKRLSRYTFSELLEAILTRFPEPARLQVIARTSLEGISPQKMIDQLTALGFVRFRIDGHDVEGLAPEKGQELEIIIDRLAMREGVRDRLAQSLETGLEMGQGVVWIQEGKDGPIHTFSEVYYCAESKERITPLGPIDFNFRSKRGQCPTCEGLGCQACGNTRLKTHSRFFLLADLPFPELLSQSVTQAIQTLQDLPLSGPVVDELLPVILRQLNLFEEMGLGYLPLNRPLNQLSEGELSRILLLKEISTSLSGIVYILDEPSRGLTSEELPLLAKLLSRLCRQGNTVIFVEHKESLIEIADHLIEVGPGAGIHGGQITYQGPVKKHPPQKIQKPKRRKKTDERLHFDLVKHYNLDIERLQIPLGQLVGLTGRSGSGKSLLARDVITASVDAYLKGTPPPFRLEPPTIHRLSFIDQKPAQKSVRSMPATTIGIMTPLRQLFAATRLAKARGYGVDRFSLAKKGGRCEACEGHGEQRIKLEMLADLYAPCEICQGKRYNSETLQVCWSGHPLSEVLSMSAEEALHLFGDVPAIRRPLELMTELGLDYLTLGQKGTTLSGGEMQRLKLVSDLAKVRLEPTLYILDEPSMGLHRKDREKLGKILTALVDSGHSVLLVETSEDLLWGCDHLIRLGPGAGPNGGRVTYEGAPEGALS